MAIIDPDGLFNGERLAKCSDNAKLYWPYFYTASNSYARLELDYRRILARVFSTFGEPPSEEEFWGLIQEYHNAFLLFLYEVDGQVWGQWDTDEKYLPRYHTVKDKESPEPPAESLRIFRAEYRKSKQVCGSLQNILKISKTFHTDSHGVGVGVGIGVGVGVEEELMTTKSEIETLCRKVLQLEPEKSWDMCWEKIRELTNTHGRSTIVTAFQSWAGNNQMSDVKRPVNAFLSMADEYLGDAPPPKTGGSAPAPLQDIGDLEELCRKLYAVVRQPFADKNRIAIGELLIYYPADEILAAWKDFTSDMTDSDLRFAPKNFCKGAAKDIILTRRADLEKARKDQELLGRLMEQRQAEVAAEDAVEEEPMEDLMRAE